MAKLAARPRRRRRRRTAAVETAEEAEATEAAAPGEGTLRPQGDARAGAPPASTPTASSDAALEDFVESQAPPPERPRRQRGRRFTRDDYHAWLRESGSASLVGRVSRRRNPPIGVC